jgi:glucosylceramidase
VVAGLLAWGPLACSQGPPTSSHTTGGGGTVQTLLSTADHTKTLSHEPNLTMAPLGTTAAPTISVDADTTYQRMIGFGAAMTDASAYLMAEVMSATQREALLQELFGRPSGLGLSFVRVPFGASDFSLTQYSYDDMPAGQTDPSLANFSLAAADRMDKLPVLQRALAINPQLFIMGTPWSPPGWMKTPASLIGGTLNTSAYGSFAEYLARAVEAYDSAGVAIGAISVQNEPDNDPTDYPGMLLEAPARAMVIGGYVGPRFARLAPSTEIWDWDHNWDTPSSPLSVLGDGTAGPYVQGVAWHCYAGDVSAQSQVKAAYPDKDVYTTECSGGDWSTDYPTNLRWFVGTMIIGATRNWARAVAFWNLALDPHDGPHTGGCTDCRGVVTIDSTGGVTRNVEYVALAHASLFVRPGAARIASTSGVDSLLTVAFQNADDHSTVLLVLNSGHATQSFAVRSGANGFQYTLPGAAVVTFSWQ